MIFIDLFGTLSKISTNVLQVVLSWTGGDCFTFLYICVLFHICLLKVDETTGRMTGTYKTYAICGAIRRMVDVIHLSCLLFFTDGLVS